MKITIRSLVLASAVLATAAFSIKTAMAATTLNVPFAFTVGNETCPAGQFNQAGWRNQEFHVGCSSRRSGSGRHSSGA
jgi:hypothetical protein